MTQAAGDGLRSPELGALICTRGMRAFERWLLVVVLGLIGAGTGAIVLAVFATTPNLTWWGTAIGVGMAALVGLLCVVGIRAAFRRVEFCEGGAVDRGPGRYRVVMYGDVTRMAYALNRQYMHGIYAGTNLQITMQTFDERKLRYLGKYKEKPKGWAVTVLGKRFEASDEMDVVRNVIAAHVAGRMTDAIARGESVDWAGNAVLSAEGITPSRGARKRMLVAWERVSGLAIENGMMRIYEDGGTKSFLDVAVGGWNVFPALELIATMVGMEVRWVEEG